MCILIYLLHSFPMDIILERGSKNIITDRYYKRNNNDMHEYRACLNKYMILVKRHETSESNSLMKKKLVNLLNTM